MARVGETNPSAEELNRARDDLEQALTEIAGKDGRKLTSIIERFIDANIKWATDRRY